MLNRPIAYLRSRATLLLALAIFAGLVAPRLAALLRPFLEPTIVILLSLPLLRVDWSVMGGYVRRPGLAAAAAGWQVIFSAVVLWAVAQALDLPPGLAMVLVIWGCAPPILSAPTFALLLRLDAELVVVLMVAGTLALPITLPPLALWLAGLELLLSPWAFVTRVGLFLAAPFAVAWAVRRAVPAGRLAAAGPAIEAVNVILLLIFAAAVMDGVAQRIAAEPLASAAYLAAAFATNIAFQVGTGLAFWRLGRRAALSMGFCAGNRNMGVMWGLAGAAGGADLLFYVAVAQVPVFLLPVIARHVYRRLM